MAEDDSGLHSAKARSAPEVVAPTNRVNVDPALWQYPHRGVE